MSQVAAVSVIRLDKTVVGDDGQFVSMFYTGSQGEQVMLDFHWEAMGPLLQAITHAAKMAAEKRDPNQEPGFPKTVTLINGFAVGGTPDGEVVVITLHAPDGLRFDFAVPTRATVPGSNKRLVSALADSIAAIPLPIAGAH